MMVFPSIGPLWGLSPRLRGNQVLTGGQLSRLGSIPAPAGEPLRSRISGALRWVYPRACGGTVFRSLVCASGLGLSPRLRGNLPGFQHPRFPCRSIPAPAGEPQILLCHRRSDEVYPRACGGTSRGAIPLSLNTGLSPRLRGNHPAAKALLCAERSIPAPAGEPCKRTIEKQADAVYPRACGGTCVGSHRVYLRYGLSPRLRGNPSRIEVSNSVRRSIPAPAGEPICVVDWRVA